MAMIDRDEPNRPFLTPQERENRTSTPNRDHVSNEPDSNDLMENDSGDREETEGD